MEPRIPVGSVVIDVPERPTAIRVGQVLTYEIPVLDHRVVSHRVVKIVSGGDRPVFTTKGDANAAPDPWLAQAGGSTLWRVRAVVPWAGWALRALRQTAVRRSLMWALPALLAAIWISDIWRKPDRRRRRIRRVHETAPA
jgi:signal peptidase